MSFDTTHQSNRNKQSWRIGSFIIFIVVLGFSVWGGFKYADSSWGVFAFKTDLATNWMNIFTKYFFIIVALERAAAVWTGLDRNQKKRAWERRVTRIREFVKQPNPDSLNQTPTIGLADLQQMYHRESKIINEINHNALRTGEGFLGIIDPYEKVDGKAPSYTAAQEKAALLGYARVTKQIYEFKLTKFEEQTYKLITRIVFVGGVIMAFVGLSILGDILNVDEVYRLSTNAGAADSAEALIKQTSQFRAYRIADILITGGLLGGGSKSFSVFINTLSKLTNRVKDPQGET